MFYVINNMVFGGDISALPEPTDTIEDAVWELYCSDPTAYKIENGKFIKLKDEAELRANALNQKYIPDTLQSLKNFAMRFYAENAPLNTDEILLTAGLYSEWTQGEYEVGDIRNYAGQTWECHQAHDNAIYPDINPNNLQTWATFWHPLHGKTKESARPWTKPVAGTTDMYHAGEYMIYTDAKTYKCVSDTVYSPEEYAQAWEVQA